MVTVTNKKNVAWNKIMQSKHPEWMSHIFTIWSFSCVFDTWRSSSGKWISRTKSATKLGKSTVSNNVTYSSVRSHAFNFKTKSVWTVFSGIDWGFLFPLVLIYVTSFINLISLAVAIHFPQFNNITNFVRKFIVFLIN